VEIDIGVSTAANFDKLKGLQWGQSLKHAKDSKAKGFGLSGGFGKGNEGGEMKVLVSGGRGREEDPERMLRAFEEKIERDAVLVKQTLGGMIRRPEVDRPYHMVGTFRGSEYFEICHVLLHVLTLIRPIRHLKWETDEDTDELHFTEITGTVQMRPQFHHLDAQSAITKTTLSRASGKPPSKPAQPITTAVTIAGNRNKSDTDSGVSSTYEATNKFLEKAADENWKRLWYRDEEEPEAFRMFEETMVVKVEDGVEVKELRSEWGREQYLDAIRDGGKVEEERKVVKKVVKKKIVKKVDAVAGPSKK
jgi:DNA-directed RNA polymerase-3 subunit RPC5